MHDIDRSRHPLASHTKSLTVETSDDVYLFEAVTSAERDKFVHGLKLVVARLASQLISGDLNVYDDFFTPSGSIGRPPDWISGN